MKFPLPTLRARVLAFLFLYGLTPLFAQLLIPLNELPYATDFTAPEEYEAGVFTSHPVWGMSAGLHAEIVEEALQDQRYLSFQEPGWIVFAADPEAEGETAATVIWSDMVIRPVFAMDPAPQPQATSLISLDGEPILKFTKQGTVGKVFARDGVGLWRPLVANFPLGAGNVSTNWIQISLRVDYDLKKWDLHVNGVPVLLDLGVPVPAATRFQDLVFTGDPDAATDLDAFFVGEANPLFEDSSGEGLPDAWLAAHGLDVEIPQRLADPDRDGLPNYLEYLLGTNPVQADTDDDGLDDGTEVAIGNDPNTYDHYTLGTVPFFEGFESDEPGPFLTGTRSWILSGGTAVISTEGSAPEGAQYLLRNQGTVNLAQFFNVSQSLSHPSVYIDLHLQVSYRPEAEMAQLDAYRRASGFYVGPDGKVVALSGTGNGGENWIPLNHLPLVEGEWARFTVHHHYPTQTWSLWLNGVRIAENLGFRDPVPALSLLQFDRLRALDGLRVAATEPAELDNDGDGLVNTEETTLGTNPNLADSSGDGMGDLDKIRHGLDPLQQDAFIAKLQPDGQGGFHWHTEFAAAEGFTPGALHGQDHWQAVEALVSGLETVQFSAPGTAASLQRFFGARQQKQIWLSFRARFQPGELPAQVDAEGKPLSLVMGYRDAHTLSVYLSPEDGWQNFPMQSRGDEWNEYALLFDYHHRKAMLLVNGRILVLEIPHQNTLGQTFTRLRILRQSGGGEEDAFEIDRITLSTAEPPDLDFSGDGMTNSEKRALGLNPFLNDNSGDGFPDVWKIAHGLDPLQYHEATVDLDGDGLNMLEEYQLGTHPLLADTDDDGYTDWEEVMAGTSPLDAEAAPEGREVEGWTLTDIGQTHPSALFRVNGKIVLNASGIGVRPNLPDSLSFLHRTLQGDFALTLRIHDFEPGQPDAHLALMVRRDVTSNASLVSMAARGHAQNRSYTAITRPTPGVNPVTDLRNSLLAKAPPHRYLRLVKHGDIFTLSSSVDGLAFETLWELVHFEPGPYQLGVALNAHSPHEYTRASFTLESFHTDSNGDGLWDHEKAALGLDPLLTDSDGDGISDFDEVRHFHSNPLVADLPATPVQVLSVQGSSVADSAGSWTKQGGGIYATDSVGFLTYILQPPEPGIYRVTVRLSEQSQTAPPQGSIFDLRATLQGRSLGTGRLLVTPGQTGDLQFYLPYLPAAPHTLRLDWINAQPGSRLFVHQLILERFDGPDADENGRADWIDHRIAQAMGADELPARLFVSPIQVEGNTPFPEWATAAFATDSDPTELLPVDVRQGLARRYFVDVPLDPEEATHLHLDLESGLHPLSLELEWSVFNLAEQDGIYLRQHDSLLLSASLPNQPPQSVELELIAPDGTSSLHTLAAGGHLQFSFDQIGVWTARTELTPVECAACREFQERPAVQVLRALIARHERLGNQTAAQRIRILLHNLQLLYELHHNCQCPETLDPLMVQAQIQVSSANLLPSPFLFDSHTRNWTPSLSDADIELQHDPGISLIETDPTATPRSLLLSSTPAGGRVVARLPENGAILDAVGVGVIINYSDLVARDQIVETFSDGSVMISTSIHLSQIPEGLIVKIDIYRSGVTFDDGTILRTLTAADFDQFGRYNFFLIISPGVTGGACHTISFLQDD